MRFRRTAAVAVALAAAGVLTPAAPASAVRLLAGGHIKIFSDATTGLASFTVTGLYSTNFDCAWEPQPIGINYLVVLCTPKPLIPDTTYYCTHWIATATASPGLAGPGEVRGTASCAGAGGDAVTALVRSDTPPTSSVVHGFPDGNIDVWAIRCVASGTGVGGAPSPGYHVDCWEPDIHVVKL